MPLLYGWPADLLRFARELAERPLAEVIDRQLAAPLVHELTHLGRVREVFPLHLDECVAGWLGVTVLRGFAWPDPGDEGALYAALSFAQVGQALARACGAGAVVRAHAGVTPWAEALPAGLADALVRLGWQDYLDGRQLHLLSDPARPERWMKLFFLAAAGAPLDGCTLESLQALSWTEVPAGDESALDDQILVDALDSMCLRNQRRDGSFVVETRPQPSPIEVDLIECRMSTAPGDGCDERLSYLFPPAVAARLRARGLRGYTLELRDLAARGEVTRAIRDGGASRARRGYTLTRR
jgi:hypothetical protein